MHPLVISVVAGEDDRIARAALSARAPQSFAPSQTRRRQSGVESRRWRPTETHHRCPDELWRPSLLSAVGEVVRVDDEALIDAATAVAGSGPAYVFYLTECLAKAGTEAGLPADLAMRLARATVAGAGELMRASGLAAETLRRNVTSPKGTTQAALDILMAKDGSRAPVDKSHSPLQRSRSRELAS
jgi:pyrroline-5-carboxylate reductase